MRKAQRAGRKANNKIDAVRQAPCAFPLAAGGISIQHFLFVNHLVVIFFVKESLPG